ncbi:hypothetical protein MTR67_032439 [Solanum verrucosum]|uniref:MULE transposase domain-containing protein n=1 Tax=Solanum verrucosum TaxID=315347 RepID=A0AAF0U4F9_SOLVR|nr:hypothetical protein MTR67_032439 [Solanum verrucosum]
MIQALGLYKLLCLVRLVFVVDEGETIVLIPNICDLNKPYPVVPVEVGTDYESNKEDEDQNEPIPSDYNSDELEVFRKEKSREINDKPDKFLELERACVRLEKLEGSYIDEFNKLEGYVQELRDSNPGGLRPFIGLDETFLKGKCKGILLVAMGQDSVKHFYPLAWPVVARETSRTWKWFVELLRHSLDLANAEGVTFMSDMQKMKKLLWWSALSTYEEEFQDQSKVMGVVSKQAAKDLVWYPALVGLPEAPMKKNFKIN